MWCAFRLSPAKASRRYGKHIWRRLAPAGPVAPESGAITSIRHEALLRESREALANARRAVDFGLPPRNAVS